VEGVCKRFDPGELPYAKVRGACQNISIKAIKETDLGVA